MALDAEKRIPDTTLPANSFKDGDILYGSDMNRVVDTLKTAVNENYKDLKGAVKGGDGIYIEPIEGVVDAEGQPIDTVDGLIKWLYDNKVLNEGKVHSLRINDLGQFEYYDGESWNLATVGQQGDPGEGVPIGGLSGQFLRKKSDVSYDTEWVDAYDKPQVDTFIANLNNATRINLLKPTLQTQTQNGVTCTNNGGTYTLNGTTTSDTVFWIGGCHLKYGKYKLLGTPNVNGCSMGGSIYGNIGYNGVILEQEINGDLAIVVSSGTTMNNAIFKPMITTNLNATYDDFVPYEDSLATNRVIATKPVTLGTSWTSNSNGYYTQTIACNGITSSDNPTIDVVLSDTLAEMQTQQDDWGKILKVETSTNALIFYASEATTVSLTVLVKGV